MRRAYVVVGETHEGVVDVFYAVCHSMAAAEELCVEAKKNDPNFRRVYTWHEVIEEDD